MPAWVFPRALLMPGWKHALDGVLQRSLSSLRFFPQWLDRFKAVVSLLRRETAGALWSRALEAHSPAVAQVLLSISLPSFAAWRWATLFMSAPRG